MESACRRLKDLSASVGSAAPQDRTIALLAAIKAESDFAQANMGHLMHKVEFEVKWRHAQEDIRKRQEAALEGSLKPAGDETWRASMAEAMKAMEQVARLRMEIRLACMLKVRGRRWRERASQKPEEEEEGCPAEEDALVSLGNLLEDLVCGQQLTELEEAIGDAADEEVDQDGEQLEQLWAEEGETRGRWRAGARKVTHAGRLFHRARPAINMYHNQ